MNEILNNLTRGANNRLDSLNVEFSSIARETFDELLENAANRMINENRTSQNDIDLANSNIRLLIKESSKGKERQIGGDNDLIRFTALNNTRKSLCPLWPIC